MAEASRETVPDYYSVLGVNSTAGLKEIREVCYEQMKLYHPDNTATGNPVQFQLVKEAFRVLTDPIQRTEFDRWHGQEAESEENSAQKKLPEKRDTSVADIRDDLSLGREVLQLLYQARRNDVSKPGLGVMLMEKTLGCDERALDFHIWYLKEKGWAQRTEGGTYAITASGVDRVAADIEARPYDSDSEAD